jgi:hypothetical protein
MDPSSLDRNRGSAAPNDLVSPTQAFRLWQDSVRGRVGALVRGPWWIIRGAVDADEIYAWYVNDMKPEEAAVRIAAAWITQTPAQIVAHRARILEHYDEEAVRKFDKAVMLRMSRS